MTITNKSTFPVTIGGISVWGKNTVPLLNNNKYFFKQFCYHRYGEHFDIAWVKTNSTGLSGIALKDGTLLLPLIFHDLNPQLRTISYNPIRYVLLITMPDKNKYCIEFDETPRPTGNIYPYADRLNGFRNPINCSECPCYNDKLVTLQCCFRQK